MINLKEHEYDDDPRRGHPDVKTRLPGVNYFFIGNGHIQAAVQWAPDGEGTPLGLLIMNPEQLGKKRDALTMEADNGLSRTAVGLYRGDGAEPLKVESLKVEWTEELGVPTVKAVWKTNLVKAIEYFYCPEGTSSRIIRLIALENQSADSFGIHFFTAVPGQNIDKRLRLMPYWEDRLYLEYTLDEAENRVTLREVDRTLPSEEWKSYWKRVTPLNSGDELLDRFYRLAAWQLPAVISQSGVADAAFWQYNREWVRDQSQLVMALVKAGHHEVAATMLNRLFRVFVSDSGDTVDSSERRDRDEVELDQNGALLHALRVYTETTGDWDLARRNWEKVFMAAEYPLGPMFRREPSGLLFNRREYWERHQGFGIEEGCELAYQMFNVVGLRSAAFLADNLGHPNQAHRWWKAADELNNAMMTNPSFRMFDDRRGFIKRRSVDGSVAETIDPPDALLLPQGIPISSPGDHRLNPDTECVLPIIYSLVGGDSPLAEKTLAEMETLWNQRWDGGGYGRYNASSEADSPGPWPFASLFVARAYLRAGRLDKVQRVLEWLDRLDGSAAGGWFEVYCDRISPPFSQLGIIPWTWAEMIMLGLEYKDMSSLK